MQTSDLSLLGLQCRHQSLRVRPVQMGEAGELLAGEERLRSVDRHEVTGEVRAGVAHQESDQVRQLLVLAEAAGRDSPAGPLLALPPPPNGENAPRPAGARGPPGQTRPPRPPLPHTPDRQWPPPR